eukprot:247538-Amphidinium_carterae.1
MPNCSYINNEFSREHRGNGVSFYQVLAVIVSVVQLTPVVIAAGALNIASYCAHIEDKSSVCNAHFVLVILEAYWRRNHEHLLLLEDEQD